MEPNDVRDKITNGFVGRYSYDHATVGGIAIHHSVTSISPDVTPDEEFIHLQAIDNYHASQGWGGFGYHLAAFPSGTLWYCGDLAAARAHVANRNYELLGLVLIGDFTVDPPPPAQLEAAAWGVAFIRSHWGPKPILGHRHWALPAFATACPGDTWQAWISALEAPPVPPPPPPAPASLKSPILAHLDEIRRLVEGLPIP